MSGSPRHSTVKIKSTATVRKPPKLRRHKASGRGYVELNGHRQYLGPFDAATTREAYHRLIAEWEANGRQTRPKMNDITIVELVALFWAHAKTLYRRANGTFTSELDNYRQALRPLKFLYGSMAVREFGPRALKAVRHKMIESGWSRKNINKQVSRLKTVFRWGTEEELVPAEIHHALLAVSGLRKGRSTARETEPIVPVPQHLIDAIKPFVSSIVWDMIQVQLLTACRPEEVTRLRAIDIDMTSNDWIARFNEHKTDRFGRDRLIFFGPRAQVILRKYLVNRAIDAYLFSAAEADAQMRAHRRARRTTPLSQGNGPGTNRRADPQRLPRDRYDTSSYRRAINRACDQAFPLPEELSRGKADDVTGNRMETIAQWRARLGEVRWAEVVIWQKTHRWSPNRLRHNAATILRQEFGVDVAQTVLGHAMGSRITAQVYAEANIAKAIDAIRRVG